MYRISNAGVAAPTVAGKTNEGRYLVRLAQTRAEISAALRLRHRVFSVELGGQGDAPTLIETDQFDPSCTHLIVICRDTGQTVGTYRVNMAETIDPRIGFYSDREFTTEHLPAEVLENGIEIGRACIDRDHRNTKVLFLLWKGLLHLSKVFGKQFFFGCCSIFTRDGRLGSLAYRRLEMAKHLSTRYRVVPRSNAVNVKVVSEFRAVKLPSLFEMYLKLGAEVCGPPMIDREFGSIDFFVVFDTGRMNEKYRKMFAR